MIIRIITIISTITISILDRETAFLKTWDPQVNMPTGEYLSDLGCPQSSQPS